MLKFNNYPPQEEGDVQLTDGARASILRNSVLETKNAVFSAYGESIGRTVVASLANTTDLAPVQIFDMSHWVTGDVFNELFDTVGEDLTRKVRIGFEKALNEEISMTREARV
jgi:hypothetical protein